MQGKARISLTTLIAALVIALALGASSGAASTANADEGLPPEGDYVPGRLIVKFRADASADDRAAVRGDAGALLQRRIEQLGTEVLEVPPQALQGMRRALANNPLVEEVSVDYVTRLSYSPDDPNFNDGHQYGPQIIQAPDAWDMVTGQGVTVAIVDSGVASSHPEFQGRLIEGRNFMTYPPSSDTEDDCWHGTHVAGIAAATMNNGEGMAGIAPGTQIMPVKVVGSSCSGSISALADGIVWAADNGARIINVSIGASWHSSTLEDAVNYAHGQGALVVVSAGNNNSDVPFYPGSYEASFSVAGTNAGDGRYQNSNYGSQIDIAAPGNRIWSTYANEDYPDIHYVNSTGTSMAAPHVAGVGALLLQVNPNLTVDELETIIEQTAEDLGAPGWDQYYGHGRINAYRAVGQAAGLSVGLENPEPESTVKDTISVQVSAADVQDPPGTLAVEIKAADDTWQPAQYNTDSGYYEALWDTSSTTEGWHAVDARATDSDGYTLVTAVDVYVDDADPTAVTLTNLDAYSASHAPVSMDIGHSTYLATLLVSLVVTLAGGSVLGRRWI